MPSSQRTLTTGSRRGTMLCCLIAAMVTAILLAGLAVLIFWLIVRPKPIEYSVSRAVVRHFNVTSPPDAALNATFYLTLLSDNPSRRVSMHYDQVELYVYYGSAGAQLAVAGVPAFHQPYRNETQLSVRAVARSTLVADQTARELAHDSEAGAVSLDVRMRSRVRFKVAGVMSRYYGIQVFCSPVVINLSPSPPAFQGVSCDVALS